MNNPGNKLLKDLAKLTTGIATLTGIHGYYLTYANQGKSEEQNVNMLNKMDETNKILEASLNKTNLNEEKLDNVVHRVQSLREKVDSMVALRKEEQEKASSLVDYFSKKDVDFNKDFNLIKKELDEICDLYPVERTRVLNQIGSSSSSDNLNNDNNLINNFLNNNDGNNNSLWENYKEYINTQIELMQTLSLTKQGAIIHIANSVFVLLCLLSLITVFYGDSIIKYFNFEEKYPRIAKYIQLRRKFQQYYFFLNALLIFIFTLIILVFNILVFIYVD